jgi:hypothetical protein
VNGTATISNGELTVSVDPAGDTTVQFRGADVLRGPVRVAGRSWAEWIPQVDATQTARWVRSGDGSITIHTAGPRVQTEIVLQLPEGGRELLITVTIANTSRTDHGAHTLQLPVPVPAITGGSVPGWGPADLAYFDHREDWMHPGTMSRVGAWWLQHKDGLIGFSPVGIELVPKILCRNGGQLAFTWIDTIRPRGARTYKCVFRFSPGRDPLDAIQPYCDSFRAEFPSLAYSPDDRPWVMFTHADPAKADPANPYGFTAPWRRIDTPDGRRLFVDRVARPMAGVGAGAVLWVPAGYSRANPDFPPAFWAFPAGVQASIADMASQFAGHGQGVGLLARPNVVVTPGRPSADGRAREEIVRVPPGGQYASWLIEQMLWAAQRGVDRWYFDAFGQRADDAILLRQIRAALGPAAVIWCEHASDVTAALAGTYCEISPNVAGDLSLGVIGMQTIDIIRALAPGASVAAKPRVAMSKAMPWATDRRITLILEDYEALEHGPALRDRLATIMAGKAWATR